MGRHGARPHGTFSAERQVRTDHRGRTQFTGRIDAVNAEQSVGGTEVTFHGRDDLALLHDSLASADRSFDDAAYDDLVTYCLTDAGIAEYTLFFTNQTTANARAE